MRFFPVLFSALIRRSAVAPLRTPDYLIDDARQETGLEDFGPPVFIEGFRRLHDALASGAGLHRPGAKIASRILRAHLVNRLCIEHAGKADGSIRQQRIIRPVFILGLPRTGSTFLQRILAFDPDTRCLLFSESGMPAPRPGQMIEALNAERRLRAMHYLEHARRHSPGLSAFHAMAIDDPEECYFLLRNSFMHGTFSLMGRIRSYREWLESQDMALSYRDYHLQLRILQSQRAARRWVLKAPSHWNALEVWRSTFPDARIIQTHRNPEDVVPSLIRLMHLARSVFTKNEPEYATPWLMRSMAENIRSLFAIRNTMPPGDQVDILYEHLVEDPIREVRRIYRTFGMPLAPRAEEAMRSFVTMSTRERKPRNVSGRELLRVSSEQVREVFSTYHAFLEQLEHRNRLPYEEA